MSACPGAAAITLHIFNRHAHISKTANYMGPDLLYDKGGEWQEYFQNQFMK